MDPVATHWPVPSTKYPEIPKLFPVSYPKYIDSMLFYIWLFIYRKGRSCGLRADYFWDLGSRNIMLLLNCLGWVEVKTILGGALSEFRANSKIILSLYAKCWTELIKARWFNLSYIKFTVAEQSVSQQQSKSQKLEVKSQWQAFFN